MPTIEIKQYRCPRCGKMYEDSARGNFPHPVRLLGFIGVSGKPCKECTELIIRLGKLERQLIAQDFSLEQEDEKIVRQINALLVKESSGVSEQDEGLLTALAERMLQDEKRRKRIIKQILKLQKRKR